MIIDKANTNKDVFQIMNHLQCLFDTDGSLIDRADLHSLLRQIFCNFVL